MYKNGIFLIAPSPTQLACGGSHVWVCMRLCPTGAQQGIFSGNQQQQQQVDSKMQMVNALVMPVVFGDSRDQTIKKFNQLQAYCGHGKGIVNPTQTIDFNHDNPYCRFKVRTV